MMISITKLSKYFPHDICRLTHCNEIALEHSAYSYHRPTSSQLPYRHI